VRLDSEQARRLFLECRVARLATVTPAGNPHLVPVVFAVVGETLYTAVDAKPKTTLALRRLANIAAHPQVTLLADHYCDDWTQLWWARADGLARLATGTEATEALNVLATRYRQYQLQRPPGPVVAVDITVWTGWAAFAPYHLPE
jgi:PPOX class probable F420-dependent enzyme